MRRKPLEHHGESRSRLYMIWTGLKSRCHNEKHVAFRYYGAKGIKLCAAWRNSFASFRDWALSHGYQEELSIERKDPARGYGPSNCKWTTMAERYRKRLDHLGYRPFERDSIVELMGFEDRLVISVRALFSLSRSSLARRLGVSKRTVEAWEQERRKPTSRLQAEMTIMLMMKTIGR